MASAIPFSSENVSSEPIFSCTAVRISGVVNTVCPEISSEFTRTLTSSGFDFSSLNS